MINVSCNGYLKISKPAAKKLHKQYPDIEITVVPCNMSPNNEWGVGMVMSTSCDFDNTIRDFEIHNCNSRETGLYAAFYVKEDDTR